MSATHPCARTRVSDKYNVVPVRGAVSEFARAQGLSRMTVLGGLKAGRLAVEPDGTIAPTGQNAAELSQPPPAIPWKERNPAPARGAFTRARARFNLGINPLYLRLQRGDLIVDPQSREIVRAVETPPTAPSAPDTYGLWYTALDTFEAAAYAMVAQRPATMKVEDAIGSLAGALKRIQGTIAINASRGGSNGRS